MAQHTISIKACIPDTGPDGLHVKVGDLVQFCSADDDYDLASLTDTLRNVKGPLAVPANACTAYYIVDGKKGKHPFTIKGPQNCCVLKHGPPEIIIDN